MPRGATPKRYNKKKTHERRVLSFLYTQYMKYMKWNARPFLSMMFFIFPFLAQIYLEFIMTNEIDFFSFSLFVCVCVCFFHCIFLRIPVLFAFVPIVSVAWTYFHCCRLPCCYHFYEIHFSVRPRSVAATTHIISLPYICSFFANLDFVCMYCIVFVGVVVVAWVSVWKMQSQRKSKWKETNSKRCIIQKNYWNSRCDDDDYTSNVKKIV